MYNTAGLRQMREVAKYAGNEDIVALIDSHLQANYAITQLRADLQAVQGALDAIDSDDFEKAIGRILRLSK